MSAPIADTTAEDAGMPAASSCERFSSRFLSSSVQPPTEALTWLDRHNPVVYYAGPNFWEESFETVEVDGLMVTFQVDVDRREDAAPNVPLATEPTCWEEFYARYREQILWCVLFPPTSGSHARYERFLAAQAKAAETEALAATAITAFTD